MLRFTALSAYVSGNQEATIASKSVSSGAARGDGAPTGTRAPSTSGSAMRMPNAPAVWIVSRMWT